MNDPVAAAERVLADHRNPLAALMRTAEEQVREQGGIDDELRRRIGQQVAVEAQALLAKRRALRSE